MIEKKSLSFHIDPKFLLIVSVWGYNGFIYYCTTVLRLAINSTIANFITAVYFLLLFILASKSFFRNIKKIDLLVYPVFGLIVILSYIFNVQNRVNIDSHLLGLFFLVIPCYYVGLNIDDSEKMMNALYKMSVLVIVTNWLYVGVILGTGRQMQYDNLAIAYMVLPHVLMALWFAFRRKKLLSYIIALFGCIFVFLMGSRGPLLSIIVFVMIWFFVNGAKSVKGRITLIVLGVIIILFISGNYWDSFLLYLREQAVSFNLSTRIIDSVLYGAADGSDNERMRIYGTMWSYIVKKPFLGYGIYGEWMMINYTAHNMVLELFTHYGIIFGGIVYICSLWKIVTTAIRSKSNYAKGFILVMCSFGIIRGIYAGSYLSDYIFLLMGYVVGQSRKRKRDYEENKMVELE